MLIFEVVVGDVVRTRELVIRFQPADGFSLSCNSLPVDESSIWLDDLRLHMGWVTTISAKRTRHRKFNGWRGSNLVSWEKKKTIYDSSTLDCTYIASKINHSQPINLLHMGEGSPCHCSRHGHFHRWYTAAHSRETHLQEFDLQFSKTQHHPLQPLRSTRQRLPPLNTSTFTSPLSFKNFVKFSNLVEVTHSRNYND